MTAFVIDDREWVLMRKVDHLARDLYLSLRRRMDFATGIVGDGEGKAVSWWALREDTELEGRPGVRASKPSEQQLRRRVGQLEKVGLVESIGNSLRLKFRLLAARRLSHVSNKAGGGSTGPEDASNANADRALGGYAQSSSEPKADTHQGSGFKTLNPPPTPSGDGEVDPAPLGAGQANNPSDEEPTERQRRAPSERRPRRSRAEKSELAEGRSAEEIAWETHLRWPTGIADAQRAYIARSTIGMTKELAQRVLDEWHGAYEAKVIKAKSPWPYFRGLLQNAKELGDAWEAKYADQIAAARANAIAMAASVAAEEAAHQERMAESRADAIAVVEVLPSTATARERGLATVRAILKGGRRK
ncbi:hypothetical protein K2O51_23420 [Cupriavidus pinatubonensis]|uniref:hypothetical protein n=1 Tax=Cupriavidus pinatubonensis TaxID=248026 RepID=UPI001C72BAE3|nr:hypothetical protein [Cupriavidus pinatubonensis]QYY30322.1 hypothetical protein K2O51_23420 [Cupriavidus pinatubonensis]